MGILVGTLTTVIFALWAIVITGQTRPMALLRNESMAVNGLAGCQSAALGLLLAVMFTALTSLAMESVAAGIAVLGLILIGIAILGGFFSGALWVCIRILPLSGFPMLRMAFNSLHRRGAALVFAMIALFAGVFSMSLGLAVTQKGRIETTGGRSADFHSYNLTILAAAGQENAIRQALQTQALEKVGVGYRSALNSLRVAGGGTINATNPVLVGRSDPQDYIVSGAAWGSQPDGVYVYKGDNLKAGSQMEVTFRDGTTHIFPVVGSYGINYHSIDLYPPTGLLMTADGFKRATQPDSLTYFVQVAPDEVSHVAAALGTALPQATVVDLVAYAGRFMQIYQKLFVLPMILAGLALLAGFLLVANSVSLAMLERRHEIGILKTVGYSRWRILSIFAIEYGLVGLLSTGAAVLVIQTLLAVLALASHLSAGILLLSVPALMLIAACGIGLTLLVVFGVTWNPTRISPMVVLNERD
jgi:predicted lysophospholipase L1 biosynthesis ABC-type transport system permease subunit